MRVERLRIRRVGGEQDKPRPRETYVPHDPPPDARTSNTRAEAEIRAIRARVIQSGDSGESHSRSHRGARAMRSAILTRARRGPHHYRRRAAGDEATYPDILGIRS